MDVELHSLARLLQSLNTPHSIRQGKQLHLLFFKKGLLNSTVSLANRFLQMYTRCGSFTDAHKLFDEMTERNCFSWNTMIEGCMNSGDRGKSLELFELMPCKNDYSWNVVVSGLAKAGDVGTARKLFDEMPRRDGVAWNSMIHGYAKMRRPMEAVKLFRKLSRDPCEQSSRRSDGFVLATVIRACTDLEAIGCGKQLHARILIDCVEFDTVMASSLTNLYAKCGDLDSANLVLNVMGDPDDFSLSALISGYASCGQIEEAQRLLEKTSNRSTVVWNSLISGHVANGAEREAVKCFNQMRRRGIQVDSSTIASILSAGSTLYKHDTQIHAYACKVGLTADVVAASALIDAYSKSGNAYKACELFCELKVFDTVLLNSMIMAYSNCGRIQDAKHIFTTMPCKSLISWNSMIVALSKNGCPIEALDIFCQMNELGLRMDEFSLASVISACADVSTIELGEQVFARATRGGLDYNPAVYTSLVDFYCKCGFVESGRKIFDTMVTKTDPVCWNSMLMGYATNGQGSEALTLFNAMRHAGVSPTEITFTAVLSACDHCGLVEEAWKWFHEMKHLYHIDPGIEHYTCMIDLLARRGRIEEAMNLIDHMPFQADACMWSSVLRGCVAHGDNKLGAKVAERIIELDPENANAYTQLSGILATSGNWESSAVVRNIMRENHIRKLPGYSWAD